LAYALLCPCAMRVWRPGTLSVPLALLVCAVDEWKQRDGYVRIPGYEVSMYDFEAGPHPLYVVEAERLQRSQSLQRLRDWDAASLCGWGALEGCWAGPVRTRAFYCQNRTTLEKGVCCSPNASSNPELEANVVFFETSGGLPIMVFQIVVPFLGAPLSRHQASDRFFDFGPFAGVGMRWFEDVEEPEPLYSFVELYPLRSLVGDSRGGRLTFVIRDVISHAWRFQLSAAGSSALMSWSQSLGFEDGDYVRRAHVFPPRYADSGKGCEDTRFTVMVADLVRHMGTGVCRRRARRGDSGAEAERVNDSYAVSPLSLGLAQAVALVVLFVAIPVMV